MKSKPSLRSFLLFAAASHLAISYAHAVNANWTGGGADALWSNTDNWSANPVPTTGQVATFNAAAGAGGSVIDLGAGVSVGTISFVGPNNAAYTIGAGAVNSQTLTLSGSGNNHGFGGSGTANANQITINSAILVNASQQWVINNGANPWIINGNVTSNAASGTVYVRNNGRNVQYNGILADGATSLLAVGGTNGAPTAILTNLNNSFTGGIFFENGATSVVSISNIGTNSAAGAGGLLRFGSGFGGGTLTYTGTGDTTNRVVTISHGNWGAAFTQSGTGNLNFTADTAFTGDTIAVGSPTITLQGSTAGTGDFSGKITNHGSNGATPLRTGVSAGATALILNSVDGVTIGSTVSATGVAPGTTVTGINTTTKTITLSVGTSGAVAQGASVTVDGLVNVTYLTKAGTGTWTLSSASTHGGFTRVNAGILNLTNSLALQNSPIDTTLTAAGTASVGFRTSVTELTVGGLANSGAAKNLASIFTITSGGYAGVTDLTLNPRAGGTFSYSGAIVDGDVGMTLTKTGAGTQILSGANSYTGTTTVTNGTLLVNSPGLLHASSAVSVTGGTLGGTGTINGSVTVAAAGSLAPGASAGILTVDSLDLVAMANGGSGKLKFELDADTASSDRIAVTNTLTIDTGTPVLGFSDFQFTNLGGLAAGTYTLITAGSISGGLDSGNLSGSLGGSFTGTLQKTATTIELVVTAASGFSAWQTANGGAGITGGIADDHDGDGVDNGTEFFIYGPVANSGFTELPGVDNNSGILSVTWTKAAGYGGAYYTDYVVQTSATLAGPWTTEDVPPAVGANVAISGNDVKYTFPGGPAYTDKNFARLKVTGP